MRTLGDTYRLQALSVSEVREPLDELVLKYARRHKFQGRQLKLGPLINAIVFRFLELPEPERERFAVEGLRALEAMLNSDPTTATAVETPPAAKPNGRATQSQQVDTTTGQVIRPKKGKKTG